MKDYVLELAASKNGYNVKLNTVREYLQAYILRILQDAGFFRSAAFVGGTALRFLYDMPRFSEDLDFSLNDLKNGYDFVDLMEKIKRELSLAGYNVEIFHKKEGIVQGAMIKFQELLFEAGLSSIRSQKFSIKLEIDTKPPDGSIAETKLITKYFPISFLTYNTSSLFAGKLHAILTRKYPKGRDYFDLGWYLSRWRELEPNFLMLNNALAQTGWQGGEISKVTWRSEVIRVVESLEWNSALHEVENFLVNPSDLNIFTKDNILSLLKNFSDHA